MRTNRVKQRLKAGEAVIGCVMGLPEPFVVEQMAMAGFDFLLTDMEHTPLSVYLLQSMFISARGTTSHHIIRSPWNDPVAIKQILDVGAEGIIVPWVNNRQECEAAVAACKYPPEGIRGIGPRRAGRLDGTLTDYIRQTNDEVLVLVQIEQLSAVERLDDILTTPGLDGIMVGPADLAASMGYRDDLGNPEVERAIGRILDGCLKHNVPFGMFTQTAERARKWIERGGKIATVGADFMFIDAGIAQAKKDISSILGR
jgi:2-keto-3-deoxy-L-rhamnonate aldolase RhmA